MWELDHMEGWVLKNWCFWTVVLEKTLESPLDCKEIQPVHSEGDQPWDFLGGNDAEAETQHWYFLTVVLEKTLESPLNSKEINPKGNQFWVFIGRTDVEAEAPIRWPPDVKSRLIEKTLMLGKIEGRRSGQQRMRWLNGITNSMDMNMGTLREMVRNREAWHAAVLRLWRVRHDWATELSSRINHLTFLFISSAVIPFSSCPQSFPASESF